MLSEETDSFSAESLHIIWQCIQYTICTDVSMQYLFPSKSESDVASEQVAEPGSTPNGAVNSEMLTQRTPPKTPVSETNNDPKYDQYTNEGEPPQV